MKKNLSSYILCKKIMIWFCVPLLMSLLIACGGGGGDDDPEEAYVSGRLYAAAGNVLDSDINDRNEVPIENNSIETSQELEAPFFLGGYVNVKERGPQGKTFESGDPDDFFKVSFTDGGSIRLILPDGDNPSGSVNLIIYNSIKEMIHNFPGINRRAIVRGFGQGEYFIQIQINSNATSYKLYAGQFGGTEISQAVDLNSEFVPGEVLVNYSSSSALADAATEDLMAAFVRNKKSRDKGGAQLITFKQAEERREIFETLGIENQEINFNGYEGQRNVFNEKWETIQIIQALQNRQDVEWAEPNYIWKALATHPNDEYYPLQWNYDLINLPQAWDVTNGSADVVIAVIDTGILSEHTDIKENLFYETGVLQGYDFVSNVVNAGDKDGPDPNPEDPGNLIPEEASIFHGTHVAGIASGVTQNQDGISGVGWNTKIMPIRALGKNGSGESKDVANAIYYAANIKSPLTETSPLPSKRADIINLSLGGRNPSNTVKEAIDAATKEGVIVVASAGNDGQNIPYYPASFENVLSVSAVGVNGEKAPYSNYHSTVDVAAPGGDSDVDLNKDGYIDGILSTIGDDLSVPKKILPTYAYYDGTSMAAPHVAGVIALMKSVRQNMVPPQDLTVENVRTLLSSGEMTVDMGEEGKDSIYGEGLIDAHKSVVAAGNPVNTYTLFATPASLQFAAWNSELEISIDKVGGDIEENVIIKPEIPVVEWLNIRASHVDKNGLGTYLVTVDTDKFASGGIYSTTISFIAENTTPNFSINVPISVESLKKNDAKIGTQHLLLVNLDNLRIMDYTTVHLEESDSAYAFTRKVPVGNYVIVSSSDLDNDFDIEKNNNIYISDFLDHFGSPLELNVFSLMKDEVNINIKCGFSQFSFRTPYPNEAIILNEMYQID